MRPALERLEPLAGELLQGPIDLRKVCVHGVGVVLSVVTPLRRCLLHVLP